MNAFVIVVMDLVMDGNNGFLDGFKSIQIPQFLLEFPIKGFLASVLPRRALLGIRKEYLKLRHLLLVVMAAILASLIAVQNLRKREILAELQLHRFVQRFYDEFLLMFEGEFVSNDFFGIFIDDSSEMKDFIYEAQMSKVRPPDFMRHLRSPFFRQVWDGERAKVSISRFYP